MDATRPVDLIARASGALQLVLILLMSALLVAISASAAQANQPLRGPELEVLVDPDQSLTAAEALAASGWQSQVDPVPSFGFQDGAYWFRLALVNDGPSADRYLEILYPMLDRVDVFVAHAGIISEPIRTGDGQPFETRPVAHRNLVIPVTLGTGENVVLLRAVTTGVMQMPLKVWPPLEFVQYDEIQSGIEGAYFGVMIVMIVYNLFLFLSLRESRYFYYVCHVTVSTLFLATMHGLANRYLWPDALWWQERAVPTLVALSVVFIALFVTSFLGIRKESGWGRFFRGLVIVSAVTTVASLFLPYEIVLRVAGLLSIVGLATSLAVSIQGWINGEPSARYLVYAWSAFVLGSIALALNKFGVLPSMALTEQGMLIGSVLDVVLLSIALADRVREERVLRERAQKRALDAEHAAREQLTQAVEDRTRELNEAMGRLQDVNARLEELSNVDGLTNVGNRRYFDRMLDSLWQDAEENGGELGLVLFDVDHFKSINDRFGHLQGDEVLKAVAKRVEEVLVRHDHVLARYGGEEFAVLLPGSSLRRSTALAEEVRDAIGTMKLEVDGAVLPVRVSGGVSARGELVETTTALVDRADDALYRAKDAGRNRVLSASNG